MKQKVLLTPQLRQKVRLHTKRTLPDVRPVTVAISVGEKGVWFDSQLWDSEEFLSMAAAKSIRRLLVLTNREYIQIVEHAASHNLYVDIFETSFPIFSDIKYSSCPRTNYNLLTKHLRKLDQLGISSGSLSKYLSYHHERAALKKLRFKNGYDRHFFSHTRTDIKRYLS